MALRVEGCQQSKNSNFHDACAGCAKVTLGLEFDLKNLYTMRMTNLLKTGQLKDLEGHHKQLYRLVELSVTLNSTLDLNELLNLIITTATELLECEGASLLLYDDKPPRLFFAAATGSDPAELARIPVPIDASLAGTIFRSAHPLILNDVEQDARHYSFVSDQVKLKTKNLLGVPMSIKDKTMGVLEAVNKRGGVFTESDVAILSVTAAHAAIAINNARLLKATQRALEKVQETNQIKSNFLALASHELRTPLGIIIGYATFLQEDTQGENSENANHVLGAAAQMRSLLDQMRNLTLLQSDNLSLKLEKISIQELLNSSIDEIKYSASRKNQQLVYAFEDTPIFVNVDPQRIIQAYVNILSNAIRFSADGGEVVIGAAEQGDNILAWVKDRGIGVPPDKLEKIFEEFYQVEPPNTRSYGGLGIGLPIARGLIEAQGGKVWAESEGKDQGATFKVSLPKMKAG
jgi:signal transduction histidine kinase